MLCFNISKTNKRHFVSDQVWQLNEVESWLLLPQMSVFRVLGIYNFVDRVEIDLESKTSELKTNLETQSQNFQEEVDELKSLQKETSKIIDQKIETHIEKNIDPKIVKLEEDFGKQLESFETKIENQQKVLENQTNEKINQNEILIEKSLDTAEKKITDQRLAQIDQVKQIFNTQISGLEESFERKLKSMEETIENLNNDKVKVN